MRTTPGDFDPDDIYPEIFRNSDLKLVETEFQFETRAKSKIPFNSDELTKGTFAHLPLA